MRVGRWLLMMNVALGFYNVGSIWIVHVLIYPIWPLVGSGEVDAVRTEHWHRLPGVVFVPAGLAFLGALLMVWFRPPAVPRWSVLVALGLQVASSAATALWFAPLQARMSTPGGGLSAAVFDRLMETHWVRVGLITGYGLLLLWMLARSAWPEDRERPILAA
jgi:hypothetical protein